MERLYRQSSIFLHYQGVSKFEYYTGCYMAQGVKILHRVANQPVKLYGMKPCFFVVKYYTGWPTNLLGCVA